MGVHDLSAKEERIIIRALDKLIPSCRSGSNAEFIAILLAEHFRIGKEPAKVKFMLNKTSLNGKTRSSRQMS